MCEHCNSEGIYVVATTHTYWVCIDHFAELETSHQWVAA